MIDSHQIDSELIQWKSTSEIVEILSESGTKLTAYHMGPALKKNGFLAKWILSGRSKLRHYALVNVIDLENRRVLDL